MHTVAGLHVVESGAPDGASDSPLVVLVHGSLDRAQSFRRVMRRLHDLHVVAYDRRGYAGSRAAAAEPAHLARHIDDLLALVATLSDRRAAVDGTAPRAVLVGHSYGGDVAIGAALHAPGALAAVGAFEPPMPWLGPRMDPRPRPGDGPGAGAIPQPWPAIDDPGAEVERFFRRMVGDDAWDRLSEAARASRRADGPALVADLRDIRSPAPFDVTRLVLPAVFGRGGRLSRPHHRSTTAWLATHVPGATLVEIDGAGHGAHQSHPDAFADFVRSVVHAGAGAHRVGGWAGPVGAGPGASPPLRGG